VHIPPTRESLARAKGIGQAEALLCSRAHIAALDCSSCIPRRRFSIYISRIGRLSLSCAHEGSLVKVSVRQFLTFRPAGSSWRYDQPVDAKKGSDMQHESLDEFVFGTTEPDTSERAVKSVAQEKLAEVMPQRPEPKNESGIQQRNAEETAFINALSIEAWNSALVLARCMKQRDKSKTTLLANTYRIKKKSENQPLSAKPMSALTI